MKPVDYACLAHNDITAIKAMKQRQTVDSREKSSFLLCFVVVLTLRIFFEQTVMISSRSHVKKKALDFVKTGPLMNYSHSLMHQFPLEPSLAFPSRLFSPTICLYVNYHDIII